LEIENISLGDMSEQIDAASITRQEPVKLNTDPADPPESSVRTANRQHGETTMRKFVLAAVAAASLLTAASAANAGVICNAYGCYETYYPTYYWTYPYYCNFYGCW
jgi:hypothetical protein